MFLQNVDTETRQQIENLLALYYRSGGEIPIHLGSLIDLLANLIDKEIILKSYDSSKKSDRGHVMPFQGGFNIWLNRLTPFVQRRFTAAHEAGHILRTFDYNCGKDQMSKQRIGRESNCIFRNMKEEYICDDIACYILCPQELVIKFIEDFHNIPCQLELFRKRQETSFVARLKLISKIFEIPTAEFYRYIKRQFGEEKILSLINSSQ